MLENLNLIHPPNAMKIWVKITIILYGFYVIGFTIFMMYYTYNTYKNIHDTASAIQQFLNITYAESRGVLI